MQMVCCVTMVDQLFFASIFIFKDEQLRLINFFTNNAIRMVWIGRFSFLQQKQNAITIQNSIQTTRQKALRAGANTYIIK